MKDRFNVSELASILEVYPETVRRWQRSGKLHGTKTSRKTGYIFGICDVIKFVESDPHGEYLKRWNGYLGRTCNPWQKPKQKTEEEIFKDCVRTIVHEELVRILKEGLGS
jgi:predicted site-specific integrase-resolvase